MAEPLTRYAHTPPPFDGVPYHLIKEHTWGVHDLAKEFAEALRMVDEACLAALLHDLGKYGALFQRRLQGEVAGVDHWTAGAWVAWDRYRNVFVTLAVQGHHVGIQRVTREDLEALNPSSEKEGRTLSEVDVDLLLRIQTDDGITLPKLASTRRSPERADGMLRTRMLFSALVDADFLDTESHFARKEPGPKVLRKAGPALDVDRALRALDAFLAKLQTKATDSVVSLREEVSDACAKAAESATGIFTLTAPTGSGKTLAMLRFALLHAKRNGLRRIIVVLPFLTLIEQTAKIYRDVFEGFGEDYVLEDHSMAREDDDDKPEKYRARLMAENWDAPIVITTNARFFEALHHNRPSVCRKLHRIAQSVVLCDEVQTIPLNVSAPKALCSAMNGKEKRDGVSIVTPTLATLTSLVKDFRTTVVFATATQPAFTEFGPAVLKICPYDWQPTEIIPDVSTMFEKSARVNAEWRFDPIPWLDIADEIAEQPGTLVIVNTRKEAAELTKMLSARVSPGPVLHLSTNMCVGHRQRVLQRIKDENIESTGFLVATQCVEAGVDLDFRQVYRAWAPLDSIAQAAGRCNRNGRDPRGKVVVFMPEDAKYPVGGYKQAVQSAISTVRSHGPEGAELHDPELFQAFFEKLYSVSGITQQETVIDTRIMVGDYVDVAKLYRLIPDSGDNVIVRIGDHLGEDHRKKNEDLLDELEREGLTGRLMRKLRPYTVSTFTNTKNDLPLTPLKTPRGDVVPGWFLVNDADHYDSTRGLLTSEPQHALFG